MYFLNAAQFSIDLLPWLLCLCVFKWKDKGQSSQACFWLCIQPVWLCVPVNSVIFSFLGQIQQLSLSDFHNIGRLAMYFMLQLTVS